MPLLDRDEYVEQAYFFHALHERMQQNMSTQELLVSLKQEVLSTTKLPLALDYMASELKLTGGFASAMARLDHYFTPFQTYVIREAEREEGRFDFRVALEILRREAEYRAQGVTPPGMFVYQFETLCRNRLGYDAGLESIAADPLFDEDLEGMDPHGAAANRHYRLRRPDLRPQRALSGSARRAGETDPFRP